MNGAEVAGQKQSRFSQPVTMEQSIGGQFSIQCIFLRKDCFSSKLASLPTSPSEMPFGHNLWFRRLSVFPRLQLCQGLRKGFSRNMACSVSVDNCDMVHPATDAYAGEAVEALKAGKVIAVPTDTLYGFACDACSLEAVNRIYEIKGRRHTSPVAICVGDVSDIARFAVIDHLPHGLLNSLLPGPVTVVLKRGESSILERSLNPGFDSIGVRVPDCNFIRIIARGSGTALALTSANLSGQPSSLSIKDFENLWEHCAFVYDGGLIPSSRAGSTIVDLTTPHKYRILRPGSAKEETVAILEKHSFVEAETT